MTSFLKKVGMLKLISFCIAVLLWIIVLDSKNPIITTDLNIPLRIEHDGSLLEKGLSIKEKSFPRNVTVTLKGRRDKISNINTNNVEAILDMSEIKDTSTKELFVKVHISKSGISLQNVNPAFINFVVEKNGQNWFPVEVVPQGKVKDGYKISGTRVIPENITIHDTDSVVKSIGSIKVFVDVTDATKNLSVKKFCKIFNKSRIEMAELSKKYSATVDVEIAKEVPIFPVIKGLPPKNYIDWTRTASPVTALITGDPDILSKISDIKTESIDIENATSSISKTCKLDIPKGVSLVNTPSNVFVNIVIETAVFQSFNYSSNSIRILNENNAFKYNILTKNLSVVVKTAKSELEEIKQANLSPCIDVAELKEGKHKVILKVSLPGSSRLAENVEVEIEINRK